MLIDASGSRLLLLYAVGLTVVMISCSPRQTTGPVLVSPATDRGASEKTSVTDEWSPKKSSSNSRYVIRDSSKISMSSDSAHSTSIHTTTFFSVNLSAAADSFTLDARAESVTTISTRVEKGVGSTFAPIDFHATYSKSGKLNPIKGITSSMCVEGLDPVAARILELLITDPTRHVKVGDTWSDTVSITTCRGKAAITQQNIRQYELMELTASQKRFVARIRKTTATTFASIPINTKNKLAVTGSGTGSAILLVDRSSGALLESDGLSQSTLTISTSRGSYSFTQNVSTHIELQ